MQPLLEKKIPELIQVLKEHKVKRAYVFGSVCTDRFNSQSEIAFDINEPFEGYAANFWDMEEQLKKLLNRHIDIIPEHTLKNPYFIKEMEKTKTPLYE
jgi:hypothetical protein